MKRDFTYTLEREYGTGKEEEYSWSSHELTGKYNFEERRLPVLQSLDFPGEPEEPPEVIIFSVFENGKPFILIEEEEEEIATYILENYERDY